MVNGVAGGAVQVATIMLTHGVLRKRSVMTAKARPYFLIRAFCGGETQNIAFFWVLEMFFGRFVARSTIFSSMGIKSKGLSYFFMADLTILSALPV